MKDPPELDRLDTRALERREVLRRSVVKAEPLRREGAALVLRTTDSESTALTRWPEGTASQPAPAEEGSGPAQGALRIDVASDRILRVRYAPAASVPENATRMRVGRFAGPSRLDLEETKGRLVLATPALRCEVALEPFALRLRGPEGEERCAVGGPEKNGFNRWDAFGTGVCRTAEGLRPLAVECFALRPHEAIFGFGEKFLRLDKVGQTVDLDLGEAFGTTSPRSYKAVPFFWSTRGYGVFLHHSSRITAWVGSLSAADVQIAAEDDFLDYWLILGDPKQVLAGYTEITGRPGLPPKWSFGFWQSRFSYRSAEEAEGVVRRMRSAGVPMDVLHLDTHWFRRDWHCDLEFDPERFPDPAGWMARLREQGVRVSLWQLPYVPEGSAFFDELAAADGFVKTKDGELYDVGICYTPGFEGRVGCIDFTSPAARRVYAARLRRLFELGASVIKADFGEQAPLDGVYHDGTPGHRAHNLYPLLYQETAAAATAEATGEAILWARSAWAGSQRHPVHWGGDPSANWANLGPQLAGGLSLGLSGFPFWSMDIGGFWGETGGALLVRWLQAGLFLSHARIHGLGRRELCDFDAETLAIGRDYLRLRYRLLPYLFGTAIDCAERSLPMARALVLEWPEDPGTWGLADQWLLGDALLVAPILDPSDRRRVYLPAGTWTCWWSGERLAGPAWIEVAADLRRLPLWVREGGIVPMGPELQWVDERPTEEVELRVAPFAGDGESRFLVPVDAERVPVRYLARGGTHHLEIGASAARFHVVPLGADPPRFERA